MNLEEEIVYSLSPVLGSYLPNIFQPFTTYLKLYTLFTFHPLNPNNKKMAAHASIFISIFDHKMKGTRIKESSGDRGYPYSRMVWLVVVKQVRQRDCLSSLIQVWLLFVLSFGSGYGCGSMAWRFGS